MQIKQLYYICVFLVFNGSAYAQNNYITNSDFEKYKDIPTNIGQGKKCLSGWTIPVLVGGGDYYHADSKSKKAGTGKNYFGKQQPHSGKAYAGICITKTYREYLQTKLIKTLEKGKKYKIELYICSGDIAWLGHMKGFCIIFTSKDIMIANDEPLQIAPSVIFRNETGYKESQEWEKLEAIYEADGTENYLTFGSFVYRARNESEVRTYNWEVPGPSNYAHYFIDDFTLTPVDEQAEITEVTMQDAPEIQEPVIYETGKAHIFKNIVFESGKAELLPSSFAELDELAAYLITNPLIKATITGHTDNVGRQEHNLQLSKSRGQTVLNYLKAKSVDASRLSFDGKGDTVPVATNDTEEGRQQNRRVEVVFR